jgi:hypothetical protein
MDYGYGDKRKTKKDLKQKRLNRAYKRGGQFRSTGITQENKNTSDKK